MQRLKHETEREWEIARIISFHAIAPHAKGINKPSDLFKLSSEEGDIDGMIKRAEEAKKKYPKGKLTFIDG